MSHLIIIIMLLQEYVITGFAAVYRLLQLCHIHFYNYKWLIILINVCQLCEITRM